jgi:hypothetical protein
LVAKSAKISNGRIILQNDVKIYKKFYLRHKKDDGYIHEKIIADTCVP